MISRYLRFIAVLLIVLLIAGGTLSIARAQTETPPLGTPTVATADNCASCHADVHALWHKGAHGDASSEAAMAQQGNCLACHKEIPEESMPNSGSDSTSFNSYWVDQGKPTNCLQCHVTGYDPKTGTWKADGITCESCHSPIPSNHPNDPMPIDKNTDLCATCHTDARFGWDSWKQSVHYQKDMTCSTCHNPHSTSLQLVGNPNADASALCKNCHKEIPQNATHITHANVGATCITCHIGTSKGTDDFHKVPDHDFKPKLEACNGCHADQMHGNGVSLPIVEQTPTATVDPVALKDPVLSATPGRANSLGFAGLAAVFGLIGGVVWIKIGKDHTLHK